MNRLCRGAYYDLVSFQRKVGAFTGDQARGVLSQDFDTCWQSILLILKQDEDGKYFIEWVRSSIEKTRKNSKKNTDRVNEYWRKVVAGEIIHNAKKKNQTNTKDIPNEYHGITTEIPLEIGIGNELGNENNEGGAGEGFRPAGIVPELAQAFMGENPDYPLEQETDFPILRELAIKIFKWLKIPGQYTDLRNKPAIKTRWGELVVHIRADGHFSKYSLAQINKHFPSITQSFSNQNDGRKNQQNGKPVKPTPAGSYRGL